MADTVSVRGARAELAKIIDRAIEGGATVVTREGNPVAAVVSMDCVKYRFSFTSHARRQLRAIDGTMAMKILWALTPLGDDPYRPDADVRKLTGHGDRYRLRVGDYRVIYRIDNDELVVEVIELGHRREATRTSDDHRPAPRRIGRARCRSARSRQTASCSMS